MVIFNEHRSKHNIFAFLTSCKRSKEMPLISPLPRAETLDLSGYKHTNIYLSINPYAKTSTSL
jgi:hypothetical protein